MNKQSITQSTAGFAALAIWLAFIAGWFLNIAFLINSNESTGLLIARGFGIVVPPLGSILGLIGIFI